MNPVCTHNECNPWRNSGATFTCQRVMADPNSTAQGKEQGIFGVKIFLREIFRVILRAKTGPEDDKSRQLVKKSDFYFTRFRPRPDPTDSLSPSPVMNRELIPRIRREELGAFAQAFG